MDHGAEKFLEYAQKNWGWKYPEINDLELADLLASRVAEKNFSEELSELELQPFESRAIKKSLEEEANFLAFQALAFEKWPVWYPGLPADALERIIALRRHKKDYSAKLSLAEQTPIFLAEKASREAAERAALAKLYPAKPDERGWLESRRRPASQPFGVSHQGAEYLVADWLRFLGESSVSVTKQSGDGGVDVLTLEYCYQVKHYTKQHVASSEMRDLLGTSISMKLKPILFTSSGLTQDAESFALINSIPAIQYVAEEGVLAPLNQAGRGFLISGRYEA